MDNNNHSSDNTDMPKSKRYMLLGTAAALLVGGFLFGKFGPWPSKPEQATASPLSVGGETVKSTIKLFPTDEIIGDPSEKPVVTMIEYGSLTCPHCAEFHSEHLQKVKSSYIEKKKIQYIYRDYPLDGAALKAALLARCDLSKRQAFINLLYEKQKEWTKGTTLQDIEKNLTILGRVGGLSAEQVKKCLASEDTIKDILSVQKESDKIFDIQATPTIIINDQKFDGGKNSEELVQIIDALLKTKEKP
jgi:protein-disulfide isomerase